jgi:hypothetical protein
MRRILACVVLVLVAPALAAETGERWTFCVASALEGKDVWISDVFAATRDRERLEGELKVYLQQHGGFDVDVQCPAPKDDKTAVVNAQFSAAEFNRRLGNVLHEVAATVFTQKR